MVVIVCSGLSNCGVCKSKPNLPKKRHLNLQWAFCCVNLTRICVCRPRVHDDSVLGLLGEFCFSHCSGALVAF